MKIEERLNCVWKLPCKMDIYLVTLFFQLTNFLVMLIFLMKLGLRLLWYIALNMEILLKSCFRLVHHIEKFFKTS